MISYVFQKINYYMNSPFFGLSITLMSCVVYHFDGTLEKCECAALLCSTVWMYVHSIPQGCQRKGRASRGQIRPLIPSVLSRRADGLVV